MGKNLENDFSGAKQELIKHLDGQPISQQLIGNYVLGKTVEETAFDLRINDVDYIRSIYVQLEFIKNKYKIIIPKRLDVS
jgi:hypothetical protein